MIPRSDQTATPVESGDSPSGHEHYGLRGVDVFAVAVFWTFLALVSAAARELDPRIPGVPPRVMSAVLSATYVEYLLWAVLTLPIWWLSSRYNIEGGRRLGRVIMFVVLGVVIALTVDALLLWLRERLMMELGVFRRRPPPPSLVGFGFLDDLMVYFAVLGAGVARDYFLRYHARLEETARLQEQLVQARLDAMRAQLNPHFLFNTLNAVSALADRDPRAVRRMLARLSDLLRYTLDQSTDQEVPLQRELDLLAEYVELMQIRFQGKLNVAIHADGTVRDALVPNLILQPIVENALKHGVSRVSGTGQIEVHARRRDGELILTVADNGPGPAEGKEGVGLRNTNARLRQMYGPAHGVVLRRATLSGGGGGTEAEIVLPYHTAPVLAGAPARQVGNS
jgi:two-component system LytT family sensor kinase